MTDVVVVTGTGGMGVACARRLGSGRTLVVADVDDAKVKEAAAALETDGFAVTPAAVDVADRDAVARLAGVVADAGTLRTVVHTAGLSPAQAEPERLLAVDVLGTEHVLDCFVELVTDGTVGVCIASIAGHQVAIAPERERALRHASSDDLAEHIAEARALTRADAYAYAKRVNHLRVEHHARAWGARGGRVVSISPGIIATPMGRLELDGAPEAMGAAIGMTPVTRMGTAEEIAAAAAWLASAEAGFVSGCDLRVDGGLVAAVLGLDAGGNPLRPS